MNWGIRDAAARDLFLKTFQKWEVTMRAAFSCCTTHELAEMERTAEMQKAYAHTMLSYELYRITPEKFEETLSRLITAMEKDLHDEAAFQKDRANKAHQGAFSQRAASA